MPAVPRLIHPRPGRRSTAWAAMALVLAPAGAVRSEDEPAPRIIYVNHAAVGASDGTSWADAYTDLQDALDEVVSGDQVWVAEGTYRPDRGTGDRYARYDLRSGISLYGSFAGWESCPDERIIADHPTILDGDLLGDDDPAAMPTSDCCFGPHSAGCDDEICEQLVLEVDPYCGQGSWQYFCAELAGGFCGALCRPTRSDNSVALMDARGSENVIIDGFTLARVDGFCPPSEPGCNCLSAVCVDGPGVVVRHCSFLECGTIEYFGGAIDARYADGLRLENSRFERNGLGNTSDATVLIYAPTPDAEPALIADCQFTSNTGAGGPVLDVRNGEYISGLVFAGNTGPMSLRGSRPTAVSNSIFVGNSSGAIAMTTPTLVYNCRLLGNGDAPALHVVGDVLTVVNSIVADNADTGVFVAFSSALLVNNVIYGNRNGGVIIPAGSAYIIDSVLWENTSDGSSDDWAQVFPSTSHASVELFCNSIQNWTGTLGGVGNVAIQPAFVDPDGADDIPGTEDDDFHLAPDSPLINLGHPDPPYAPYLDGDGHARILCGRIDMGAYEFGIGDYNCDRIVELDDYVGFPDCLTGPAPAVPYPSACAAYDFVTEVAEDVDLLDFAGFQNAPFSDGT